MNILKNVKNMNVILLSDDIESTGEITKNIYSQTELLRCYGFDKWLALWMNNTNNSLTEFNILSFASQYEKESYIKLLNIKDEKTRIPEFKKFLLESKIN